MNKIITCFFIICNYSAFGQLDIGLTYEESDYFKKNKIKTQTIVYFAEGNTNDSTYSYITFNENGKLLKILSTAEDGNLFIDYDHKENPLSVKLIIDSSLREYTIMNYRYDIKGRKTEAVVKDSVHHTKREYYYEYDSLGRLVKEVETSRFSSDTYYKYRYNSENRISEKTTYDKQGDKIKESISYIYDKRGNEIKQRTCYKPYPGYPDFDTTSRCLESGTKYNKRGEKIMTYRINYDKDTTSSDEYKYNRAGELIELISNGNSYRYEKRRVAYKYDKSGNLSEEQSFEYSKGKWYDGEKIQYKYAAGLVREKIYDRRLEKYYYEFFK